MLYRVTLHRARGRDFPDGSARHGYDMIVPIDAAGHLSPELWRQERARCVVRRFWAGEPDRHGHLVHRPGGAGGATWLIDYDEGSAEDDEAGYRLGTHVFREGEYVSIRDEDGDTHTFKVVGVRPVRRPGENAAA